MKNLHLSCECNCNIKMHDIAGVYEPLLSVIQMPDSMVIPAVVLLCLFLQHFVSLSLVIVAPVSLVSCTTLVLCRWRLSLTWSLGF